MKSLKQIIHESIIQALNESRESTITANKLIKTLYNNVNDFTTHRYKDDDWRYINAVFQRIEDTINSEGQLSVWCENGGYVKNKEGMPIYKEWKLRINLNNGGIIGGSVKANAAGSIEYPLDAYDITCTFWRE